MSNTGEKRIYETDSDEEEEAHAETGVSSSTSSSQRRVKKRGRDEELEDVDTTVSPSDKEFWQTKDTVIIGPLLCRLTFWEQTGSNYIHIAFKNPARRNGGKTSMSRMAFTSLEGEELFAWLVNMYNQISSTPKGQLIAAFENNLDAATMNRKDSTFWDVKEFSFENEGIKCRLSYTKRTQSYTFHFLRPNRNTVDYPEWIGSIFAVNQNVIPPLTAYLKKKLKIGK